MRRSIASLLVIFFALGGAAAAQPHDLIQAKDGSGVVGYKDTPIQPWSGYHVHDPDRPKPPKVDPGPEQPPRPGPRRRHRALRR